MLVARGGGAGLLVPLAPEVPGRREVAVRVPLFGGGCGEGGVRVALPVMMVMESVDGEGDVALSVAGGSDVDGSSGVVPSGDCVVTLMYGPVGVASSVTESVVKVPLRIVWPSLTLVSAGVDESPCWALARRPRRRMART